MPKRLMEEPVSKTTPVILNLTKQMLLLAINEARDREHLDPIPPNAEVSVRVPGGGDYSNMDLSIEGSLVIDIRWDRKDD